MVVKPDYQKQGLGKKILLYLIEQAKQQKAIAQRGGRPIAITLHARLTAVGFYQKFGFQTYGKEFFSSTTETPHITMNKKL